MANTPYSLSIGDLVERSAAVYLRNVVPFTLLGAIFLAPWIALHLYADTLLPRLAPMPRRYAPYVQSREVSLLVLLPIAERLLQMVLTYVLTAPITYGVVQQLRGQPASVVSVFSKGMASFLRVFVTGFQCAMRIFLFTLLLIVPGLVQQVRLYVAIPVAIMEGKYGLEAAARSRSLARGSGWQIFAAWLLVFLMGIGLAIVGTFLVRNLDPDAYRAPPWLDIAITLMVAPFGATMMATAYFLLRQGKENVDPKAIAAVFD